ncbi:50S ribosome-binding GTPase [Candidatus Microgenomates bacterium]|nr:50S ribosome-binding GTPase [Candidatus Microgenomates bacterium]
MADIPQQIETIEKEIRETPYHKATEHHIGKLRARLAKLKDKEIEVSTPLRQGSAGRSRFAIRKQGDATIVLIGPPSAGKSTLINKLTNAESKVAPYAFTTVTVIPGMMKYKDAFIQILDVPGLIEGARKGKGRGRQVLSVARNSDLLIIMTDFDRPNEISRIVFELEGAGIRINGKPPEVTFEKRGEGGIIIHTNIKQDIGKDTISEVAGEFGLRNAEITIKEKLTMDRLIDTFSSSRVYIPAIFVVNKIDLISSQRYTDIYQCIKISADNGTGLEELKEEIWEKLGLVRVYLVRRDAEPSNDNPIIVKKDQNLKELAEKIGTEFAEGKKLAKIWGEGVKFPGQEVSLSNLVKEGMQVRFL